MKTYLGTRKSDGAKIYISPPEWDCGWYWGFGYIGNTREHSHLSQYMNANKNMYYELKDVFDLNPIIEKNLWVFCELVRTIYRFREVAEIYRLGGTGFANNPLEHELKNEEEWTRINKVLLPKLFEELDKVCKE